MKKKLFTWLAMLCFVVPCVFGLSACKKANPNLTNYKVIVNQQLIAESREINVTYGDEIEWSAIALYDDNSITSIPVTEMQVVDEGEIIGTTPTVGEYELKFKYDKFNEYVVTLTVNPKALAVPTAEAMTYSGEEQTAVFEGFDENTMTMTGDVSAVDANTYSVSVALKDKTNYCWTGGSTTDKVVEYTINKAKIQEPNRIDKTYTYNGTSQTLELFGFDSQTMEVSSNSGINANEYTAYVDLKDADNYEWKHNAGSRIAIYWTIEKATGTAPATAPTALTGTYDPAKTLADYAVAENYAWVDDTIVPTVAVKEYAVIYNPDSANYTDFEMTYGLDIAKAKLVIPEVTGDALEYDGTEKTVELAHFDANLMRTLGESAVEVGSHTVVVVVSDDNYEFVDGTISAPLTWNIGKGTPAVTIPYNYSKPYDGQRINLPRYEMPALLNTELASESNGIVVVYKDSEGTPVEYADVVDAGTYTITVSTLETAHYKSNSVTKTFQIYYDLETLNNSYKINVKLENEEGEGVFYYTGEDVEPIVIVEDRRIQVGGHDPEWPTLEQNRDYVVNYFNNVNYWDEPYVEITGIGAFKGVIRKSFSIRPQSVIQGIAVNGNAVTGLDTSSPEVTTTSNPAGHTVTWTFNPLYGSNHTNGHFEITVRDKFYKYIGYPIVLENGAVTAVIPADTAYVSITFVADGGAEDTNINIKIYLSDVIDNNDYFEFNGSSEDVHSLDDSRNIILIRKNATDLTSTTAQLITAAFADSSNYNLHDGYSVVNGSFNLTADCKTVSIKVKKGEEPEIELVWDIEDARPNFYESYVNFEYVEMFTGFGYSYVIFDAENTVTVDSINSSYDFDFSINDSGNITKIEVYCNGVLDATKTENKYDGEGRENQGIHWYRLSDLTCAGTYTVRFYLNNREVEYEDYIIVVEEFIDNEEESVLTLTYGSDVYTLVEGYTGGIFPKVNMSLETEVEYFYAYVGAIASGVETITVAVEAQLVELYDNNRNLITDRSNIVLDVLEENGVKYTVMYCENDDEFIPFYIYFEEVPSSGFVFNFANYSMEFTYESVEQGGGNLSIWMFGDFISVTDPADAVVGETGINTIYLHAFVDAEDVDFRTSGSYADTTIAMDIESHSVFGMVIYDIENESMYSEMMSTSTVVNIDVVDNNGYELKFYVTEIDIETLTPSIMYEITLYIM